MALGLLLVPIMIIIIIVLFVMALKYNKKKHTLSTTIIYFCVFMLFSFGSTMIFGNSLYYFGVSSIFETLTIAYMILGFILSIIWFVITIIKQKKLSNKVKEENKSNTNDNEITLKLNKKTLLIISGTIGFIIIILLIIFIFKVNIENKKISEETQKVIDMINEVDFDVNAPKLNDNDKLYIKSVSKCRNQYHIQFYYYTYDNKLSTQGLITAKNSDKLYNPTVESNKYGLGGWGPQNDIFGYEDCLEDNRDNVEVSLVNFTKEEINIINENIIPNKRKHSS